MSRFMVLREIIIILFAPQGEQGVSVSIPKIITPAQVVTVLQTNTVSLPCKAIGLPTPELTWSRVYGSLPSGRHVINGNGTLLITRTLLKDAGMYVCQAKSILGTTKSTTALIIHGKNLGQLVSRLINPKGSAFLRHGGQSIFYV